MIRNKIYYSLPANNRDMITVKNITRGNLPETFKVGEIQRFYMPVMSLPANSLQMPTLDNQITGNKKQTMPIKYWKKNVSYTEIETNEHIIHPDAQMASF